MDSNEPLLDDVLAMRRLLNPRVKRYDVGWSSGWAVYWHGDFSEWYADWTEAIQAALNIHERIGLAASLRQSISRNSAPVL